MGKHMQFPMLVALVAAYSSNTARANALSSNQINRRSFSGFSSLSRLWVFGDSYSRIGFNSGKTQPSVDNPFGNNSTTSANGPNWVNYLTYQYNTSQILTYDLAASGATVDMSIVKNADVDLLEEYNDNFVPYYNSTSFDPDNTLFAFWFGINDVFVSIGGDNATYDAISESYRRIVDTLYEEHGARNFLFLNVPPIEKAPRITQSSAAPTRVPAARGSIAYFNMWHYDTNALFNEVIADPSKYEQTAGYKDTKTYCADYQSLNNHIDADSENCTYPASGYLWRNNLHPTWPLHDVLASEIAALLKEKTSPL